MCSGIVLQIYVGVVAQFCAVWTNQQKLTRISKTFSNFTTEILKKPYEPEIRNARKTKTAVYQC